MVRRAAAAGPLNVLCFAALSAALEQKFHIGYRFQESERTHFLDVGLASIEVLPNGSMNKVIGSSAGAGPGDGFDLQRSHRRAGRGVQAAAPPPPGAWAAAEAEEERPVSLLSLWSVVTGTLERMGGMRFPYFPCSAGRAGAAGAGGAAVEGGAGAAAAAGSRSRMRSSLHGDPPAVNSKDKFLVVEDGFFQSAPLWSWMVLFSLSIVLFSLDWFVIRRFVPATFKWHLLTVGFWLVVAACYNVYVAIFDGHTDAVDWLTGYVLEWALSIDNLFVFHLVFSSFQTPSEQRHKAVFVGIVGAVLARLVFFMVVSSLLHLFSWIRWPFGALLIWSGIESVRSDDDDFEVKDTRTVRVLKWCLGNHLYEGYTPDGSIFCCLDGTFQVTLLFLVIACLELTDIFFALDSVSAKIAQIPEPHIALSSTILAMFGLRAAFFVVEDLVQMFDMLKYGLCLILVLIGVELMLMHIWDAPSWLVCVVLVSIFAVCILLSVLKQRFFPQAGKESERPGAEPGDDDAASVSTTTAEGGIVPDTGGYSYQSAKTT